MSDWSKLTFIPKVRDAESVQAAATSLPLEPTDNDPLTSYSTPLSIEVVDESVEADLPTYLFDPLSSTLPTDDTPIQSAPFDLSHALQEFVTETTLKHVDSIHADFLLSDHTFGQPSATPTTPTDTISLRLVHMKTEVQDSWASGDMVKSFKVVIQAAKLIPTFKSPTSLPHLLMLVTDVLDTFADLVFSRIKTKAIQFAKENNSKFPESFTNIDVPQGAKLIASNWLGKISSVRELLPRVLIEAAVLRIYRFLTPSNQLAMIVNRLLSQCRGIGGFVTSFYVSCYICRICQEEVPASARELSIKSINDVLMRWPVNNPLDHELVSALVPLFNCIGYGIYSDDQNTIDSNYELLLNWFKHYKCLQIDSLPLISSIFSSFPANVAVKFALIFLSYIEENETTFEKNHFTVLDSMLAVSNSLAEADCLPSEGFELADVIKTINQIWGSSLSDYQAAEDETLLNIKRIDIASNLGKFVCHHVSSQQKSKGNKLLNILLKEVVNLYTKSTSEKYFSLLVKSLLNFLDSIVTSSQPLSFFALDHFVPCLSLLPQKERAIVSSSCLKSLSKSESQSQVSDAVLSHGLLTVARFLTSSISLETPIEQKEVVKNLLSILIHKVVLPDSESQLSFYTDCRPLFLHFEPLQEELIQLVLSMVVKMDKEQNSIDTIKGALAFAQITIPSLLDVFSQVKLFLSTAEISLGLGLTIQYQEIVNTLVDIIPHIPPFLESSLESASAVSSSALVLSTVRHLGNLLSTNMLCSHPEFGIYYLFDIVINSLKELYSEPKHGTFSCLADGDFEDYKTNQLFVHYRHLLAIIVGLVSLLGSIDEYNLSTLYSKEFAFEECSKKVNVILQEILEIFDPYGHVSQEAAIFMIELVNVLITFFENTEDLKEFVKLALLIIERGGGYKTGFGKNTLKFLTMKGFDV
ncbi:hypothetical protein P9112_009474 [Eukaryota sp. TZLM1-RC]